MNSKIWTTLIGIVFLVANVGCADYCNVTCYPNGAEHTMCRYKTKDLGPACIKYDAVHSVLTQKQKDDIVDLHNRYRSTVASGEEKRGNPGPQPPAAKMMELIWDNEMEMIAQRYAIQCNGSTHDLCRSKLDGTPGGQNLGISADLSDVLISIRRFYKEVENVQPQQLQEYGRVGGPMIGHYTQMVWGESSSVGCAIARYEYPEYAHIGLSNMLICNYHPAGNVFLNIVYQPGKACTACPNKLGCSTKYPGLCINPGSKGGSSTGEEVTPSQGGKPPVTPTVAPVTEEVAVTEKVTVTEEVAVTEEVSVTEEVAVTEEVTVNPNSKPKPIPLRNQTSIITGNGANSDQEKEHEKPAEPAPKRHRQQHRSAADSSLKQMVFKQRKLVIAMYVLLAFSFNCGFIL